MNKMKLLRINTDSLKYQASINKVRAFTIDETLFEEFVSNPNNLAYAVLEDEEVVAFAWGYLLERMDDAPMLYIHSVDVLEGYRQKGYGRVLMDAFLTYAREQHVRNTFLITDKENIAANKLYQKYASEMEEDKVLYIFKEEVDT